MFDYTITTLICCAVVLLISVISGFMSPFFRVRLKNFSNENSAHNDVSVDNKPLSIVVIANENNKELRTLLPLLFKQNYDEATQVIVVVEKGDAETKDILEFFAQQSNFYSTFVPTSSRYMSNKKLAITLGVKAAKYNDVVLMDACCKPQNTMWLQSFSKYLNEETSVVVPYTLYGDEVNTYFQFLQLHQSAYEIKCYGNKKGYGAISKCLALKKEQFIAEDGFRGFLEHVYGEYDFLINKYATFGNIQFADNKDAWVIEETISKKQRADQQLAYQHTKRFLSNGFSIRLWQRLDNSFLYFHFLLTIGASIYASVTQNWLLLIVSVFSFFWGVFLQTFWAKRYLHFFQSRVSLGFVWCNLLLHFWHNLYLQLKYKRTAKESFTTHKI